jgi:electron transport complex protein RnfG
MTTASHSPWRSGLSLAIAALLATALLAGIHVATRDRIVERDRQLDLERLAAVLPPDRYDNDPLADTIEIDDPRLGPGTQSVHRGRLGGKPSVLAITATAMDGYAGPIRLIVGIDTGGRILGVRVLSHSETPGLGDPIETRRSDWILGFNDRQLGDPPDVRWTVKPDGGDFDAFTGATITPRAVTRAIRRVLEFHATERDRLYDAEPARN